MRRKIRRKTPSHSGKLRCLAKILQSPHHQVNAEKNILSCIIGWVDRISATESCCGQISVDKPNCVCLCSIEIGVDKVSSVVPTNSRIWKTSNIRFVMHEWNSVVCRGIKHIKSNKMTLVSCLYAKEPYHSQAHKSAVWLRSRRMPLVLR